MPNISVNGIEFFYSKKTAQSIALIFVLILIISSLFLISAQSSAFQETEQMIDCGSLEANRPVERRLSGGDGNSYHINLASGQFLHLIVEQRGIDAVVRLFSPDGKQLVEANNSSAKQGQETISLIAEASGDHRLEVRPRAKNAAGNYQAHIKELREAEKRDRDLVAALKEFGEAEQLRRQRTAESIKAAIEKYEKLLPIWRDLGDLLREADTLTYMGLMYNSVGKKQEALDCLNRALPIRRAAGDRNGEAYTLSGIGLVYNFLGDRRKALDCYNQALKLTRDTEDLSGEASTLNNIGSVYDSLEEKKKAIEHYNQALNLFQAIGHLSGQATTFNNIGVAYLSLGEKQEALDCFHKSLSLRQAPSDHFGKAYTLNNIGSIYSSLGESEKALEYFKMALELRRTVGDPSGEANTLNNIGAIYSSMGNGQKAREYFKEALRLLREAKNRYGEAYALNNIGKVHFELGESDEALDRFKEALLIFQDIVDRRGEAFSLNYIGEVYFLKGDKQKSLEFLNKALELRQAIEDKGGEAITLFAVAKVKRSDGELKEARIYTENALELTESLRTKIAIHELRTSYLATVRDRYEFYIDLLMQLHKQLPSEGYDGLAFEACERARARMLLETLVEARADIRKDISEELLEREYSLHQQLNAIAENQVRLLGSRQTKEQQEALRKKSEKLIEECQKIEAQIRKDNPRYAALKYPNPLSLSEIREQALDRDTVLLEYYLGRKRSYLWAATPDSIAAYELPGREDIERAALRLYNLYTARETEKFYDEKSRRERVKDADAETPAAAAELSRMLLGPVAGLLGKKRLLIVRDGLLQYVPFGALPVPDADGGNPKSVSEPLPLAAEHEIVSLPSASTLAVMRHELAGRKPAPEIIAIFAHPIFSNRDDRISRIFKKPSERRDKPSQDPAEKLMADLEPLPETEQMAKQILALVPAKKSKLALGFNANLTKATSPEMSRYKIIHYATHGFLNPNPALSGVALSLVDEKGEEQKGFLSASAIYNLNLPADLVVLSACQTGLAFDPKKSDDPRFFQEQLKKISDQGFAGLTRGFVYAGAERVMVTLWKIPVDATTELMVRFYREMFGPKKLSPAAALRAAQIQMWKQSRWRQPYYWAAFEISGEYK